MREIKRIDYNYKVKGLRSLSLSLGALLHARSFPVCLDNGAHRGETLLEVLKGQFVVFDECPIFLHYLSDTAGICSVPLWSIE